MRWFYLFIAIIFSNKLTAQFENASLIVMYDSAWEYKNLKLIPVKFDWVGHGNKNAIRNNEEIISLQKAIKEKKVTLKEIYTNDGSDARVLVIKNKSKKTILVSNGEIVLGGKQDRIIAETKLIEPGKEEHYIDVYCAEKGRWDKKAKSFKYLKPTDFDLKKIIDLKKNQAEVWKEIDYRYKSKNKSSKTWSIAELGINNINFDSNYYNFFKKAYAASDSAFSGFIAVTGNRIIGCDLYANADLQELQFFSNLSNYSEVAIETGSKPILNKNAIETFIKPILSDNKTRDAYLLNRGKVFRNKEKIIHISAYGD